MSASIWVPPSKHANYATVNQFSKRTVADRKVKVKLSYIILRSKAWLKA